MSKKIYVFESGGLVKIGVSKNVKNRLKAIQTANGNEVRAVAESDFCHNAEQLESVIHISLSAYKSFGEWFDVDSDYAVALMFNTFDALAIGVENKLEVPVFSDYDFAKSVKIPEQKNGMYRINGMIKDINEFRKKSGRGAIQVGNFFVNDETKEEIARICIKRNVPVEFVKSSCKGKYGGTKVDKYLLEFFLKWASGIKSLCLDEVKRHSEELKK